MISKINSKNIFVYDKSGQPIVLGRRVQFMGETNGARFDGMRWTVAGQGGDGFDLTLIKLTMQEAMGEEAEVNVLLTDRFEKAFEELKGKGVNFLGEPASYGWGKAIAFLDCFGSRFSLMEIYS